MLFLTPTVLKNLAARPATRNYPFVVRAPFDKYRGELVINAADCILCGSCMRKCPSLCITVDKTAETWECDPYACIYCGHCVSVCPTHCLSMRNVHRAPAVTKVNIKEQGQPPKKKARTEDAD
ncbi:MAG: 4Fe-4S dicluster domain-containing protein [Desulfovibrio sp.]